MIYIYENEKGRRIEREFAMSGDIPKVVSYKDHDYKRIYNTFQISIPLRSSNSQKKDMDDFSRCKISKGNVKVKKGGSYVPAQLRIDGDGAQRLVYKSNPCRDTGVKPTNEVVDGLSGSMENFL